MEYFGTSLDRPGHYFWTLEGTRLLDSKRPFNSLPFNPEGMPVYGKNETKLKGDVQYHQIGGFSILAIYGSCVDKREGCKSVFFTEVNRTKDEMIAIILNTPISKTIIDKMPFEVRF